MLEKDGRVPVTVEFSSTFDSPERQWIHLKCSRQGRMRRGMPRKEMIAVTTGARIGGKISWKEIVVVARRLARDCRISTYHSDDSLGLH